MADVTWAASPTDQVSRPGGNWGHLHGERDSVHPIHHTLRTARGCRGPIHTGLMLMPSFEFSHKRNLCGTWPKAAGRPDPRVESTGQIAMKKTLTRATSLDIGALGQFSCPIFLWFPFKGIPCEGHFWWIGSSHILQAWHHVFTYHK